MLTIYCPGIAPLAMTSIFAESFSFKVNLFLLNSSSDSSLKSVEGPQPIVSIEKLPVPSGFIVIMSLSKPMHCSRLLIVRFAESESVSSCVPFPVSESVGFSARKIMSAAATAP